MFVVVAMVVGIVALADGCSCYGVWLVIVLSLVICCLGWLRGLLLLCLVGGWCLRVELPCFGGCVVL